MVDVLLTSGNYTHLMYAEHSLKEKSIKCKLYFRPEKIR